MEKKLSRKSKKIVERPIGITIICLIGWLFSFPSIIGGIVGFKFLGVYSGKTEAFVIITSFGFVAIGILAVLSYYGLWKMKKLGFYGVLIHSIVFILAMFIGEIFNIGIFLYMVFVIVYLITKRKLFH